MKLSTTSLMMDDPPVVRSTIYRLLAMAFRYPTPEVFQAYRDGDFMAVLWDQMARLPHLQPLMEREAKLGDKVKQDLEGLSFEDFEVGYARTFDVGAPAPPCPPYEGIHRQGGERTHVMIEISEFYKHFGLEMNKQEGQRELPDHLCAELEFLHFLTFKESQAEEEGTTDLLKGYVLAQKDFLERHLVNWLPRYRDKLQDGAKTAFYGDLARIAQMYTSLDFQYAASKVEELGRP